MASRVFHAPLISSVEGLQLAAVVERHSDQAAERYPGIATHRSLESILSDPTLDLLVVATPTGTHFETAKQILLAGKSVVVDKPMAVTSAEISALGALATERKLLLAPFHNRRWDRDFQTIQKLLHEGQLGTLAHFESNFDRWSPGATRRPWKDDPAQGGGILHDIGTHLVDQALTLFGLPLGVSAEVLRERPGEGSNDSVTLRLRYLTHAVTLGANCLSALARPRFHLRGTRGNYWKWGVDPQEAALNQVTRIADPAWGPEPPSTWGTLRWLQEEVLETKTIEPAACDYRLYYAAIRDALLSHTPPPVAARDAWRAARILEWAQQSSTEHREIPCDWAGEPL